MTNSTMFRTRRRDDVSVTAQLYRVASEEVGALVARFDAGVRYRVITPRQDGDLMPSPVSNAGLLAWGQSMMGGDTSHMVDD